MVGRNQKVQEDDDEEILDTRRSRKGGKQTRLKKPPAKEPEKPALDNDADLLADFDLDGVPEKEKAEIRKAILLSREEEKQEQIQANRLVDRRKEELQDNAQQQDTEHVEPADQQMASEDDETQPPESPQQPGFTLEDEPDSTTADEPKSPRSRDGSIGDLFEGETMAPASPSLSLRLTASPSQELDNDLSQEQIHVKEADLHQAEEGIFDMDTEEPCESKEIPVQQNRQTNRQSEPVENQHKLQSASQTRGESEASGGFDVGDHAKGDNSQESAKSDTSVNSNASVGEPLKRHYRNVRKQSVRPVNYFATEGMDPVQYTKVIMQLFDLYAKNLRVAQSKCRERVPWGEPVKPGQHQSKTIDVKKRGQGSQYVALSDSEDENIKAVENQGACAMNDKQNQDIDYDLPDLDSRCQRRLRRGGNVGTKQTSTAETQAYDPFDFEDMNTNQNIGDTDDSDFVPTAPHRTRNPQSKPVIIEENKNSGPDIVETNRKTETKGTRGRGRGRRKPKEVRVLVEDTQKNVFELSSDEETVEKRNEIPAVIGETQGFSGDERIEKYRQGISSNNQRRQESGTNLRKPNAGANNGNLNTADIVNSIHKESFYCKGGTNANIQPEAKINSDQGTSRRRGRPKKGVTLVEDTQDLDERVSGNYIHVNAENTRPNPNARPVRGKRKSFQLKSDSEEDPIPETQEMDLSPDITVVENKVKEAESVPKENVNSGSIASKIGKVGSAVFQKVKEYISPKLGHDVEQAENIDVDNMNDEQSQSPVIRKRRKLYTESEAKKLLETQLGEGEKDNVSQQKPVTGRLRRGIVTIGPETDISNVSNIAQGGPGVKKLFSRPPSKESNASDDVSITTSQGSSTFLDEHGDLYSTQLNEKPESFRKTSRSRATHNTRQNDFDNIVDGSNEEVLKVKAVKKDYRRKPNAKSGVNVVKTGNISKFFPKIHKTNGEVVNLDSESESSDVDVDVEFPAQTRNKNTTVNKPNQKKNEKAIPVNHTDGAHKFGADMQNLISEDDSSNDSVQHVGPTGQKIKAGNENEPIIPSQFMDQIDAQVHRTVGYSGARPKVLRTRKVSETITSGQLERNADYRSIEEQRLRMRNKRGRENVEETQGQDQPVGKRAHPMGKVSPVVMVPCPLCNDSFPADMIEIHASECVGDIERDEEEEHEAFAESVQAHQLRRRPLGHTDHTPPHHAHRHVHHGAHHLVHHHADSEDDDDLVDMGHHPDLKHTLIQQHLAEQEEEELTEIMEHHASQNPVRIEDAHVKDVAKDIKISPGETGEIQSCYICDEMVPKGVLLEQHIQRCLMVAKEQQMAVDKEGFNTVYRRANQPAEPDTPRTTRRGLRNQDHNHVNYVTIKMDPAGQIEREDRYSSGSEGSGSTAYGSSWSEGESESDSSVDENVTLASVARPTGPAALITAPWNKTQNQPNQNRNKTMTQSEDSNTVPDWLKNPSNSPIRSFVPINEQEDREYFERQFQYNKDRVERQMSKRKRSQGQQGRRKGRRRKRRKVSRKKSAKPRATKT